MNQKLLLDKLSLYGVSPLLLLWFSSYLNDRQTNLRVLNSLSDIFVPTLGAPQGSNLGSLLFPVFISDIECRVRNAQLLLFADNINLYVRIPSTNDGVFLPDDASRTSGWCSDNLSVVNSDETKIMTMRRKHKIISYMYLLGYTSI